MIYQTQPKSLDYFKKELKHSWKTNDEIQTEENKIQTEKDQIQTEKDKIQTEKDNIQTEEDKILTEKDKIQTEEDKILTEKDKILTEKDKILTEKVKIQTEEEESPVGTIKKIQSEQKLQRSNKNFAAKEETSVEQVKNVSQECKSRPKRGIKVNLFNKIELNV